MCVEAGFCASDPAFGGVHSAKIVWCTQYRRAPKVPRRGIYYNTPRIKLQRYDIVRVDIDITPPPPVSTKLHEHLSTQTDLCRTLQ